MPIQAAKVLRDRDAPLSPDEDVNRLEGWFDDVRRTRYLRDAASFVSIAFVMGYQWLVSDLADGRVDVFEAAEQDGKIRLMLNELLPYVEHMVSKYAQASPRLQAIPKMDADEDPTQRRTNRKAAKDSEALVDFLTDKLGLDDLDQESFWWMLTTGTRIQKVYWDDEGGRLVRDPVNELIPMTDEMGMEIPGEYAGEEQARDPKTGDLLFNEFYEGEVAVANISRFRFAIDHDRKLEEAARVCEIQPLDKDEIVERWGQEQPELETLAQDGEIQEWNLWERRLLSLVSPNTRWHEWSQDDRARVHLVKEFWERPSRKHPKGLHVLTVGGHVIGRKGTLPMTRDGQDFLFPDRYFPYIVQQDVLSPFRFAGGTVVEHLIQVQKWINMQESRRVEYERKFGGKWVAEESSVTDTEQFNDVEGEVILYDSAGGTNAQPTIQSRPALPGYVGEIIASAKAMFDDIGGRHDISQGQASSSVQSGKQAAFMVEKDDTRLGAKFRRAGQFKRRRAEMMIRTAANRYDEPRQIRRSKSAHGRFDPRVVTVLGRDLVDNFEIVEGTDMPQSRERREQSARADWKEGIYGDPKSVPAIVAYMKAAGSGAINEVHERYWLAIEKAGRENETVADGGRVPPPEPWELHEFELEEHRNFAMGDEFAELHPDAQQALKDHILLTMGALSGIVPGGGPQGPQEAGPGAGSVPPGPAPGPGIAAGEPEERVPEQLPTPATGDEQEAIMEGIPQ